MTTPTLFLTGPHGSGKTSLGTQTSTILGLRFRELGESDDIAGAIRSPNADLVTLPWVCAGATTHAAARRSGVLLGLWAHPENMLARSTRPGMSFTPRSGMKSYGRNGVSCLEFRQLDRACDEVLALVRFDLDDAVKALVAAVQRRRSPRGEPADRAEIGFFADHFQRDVGASPAAARLLTDAMARFVLHLVDQGASPRSLSGIRSDLQAAGLLVFMYDAPDARHILGRFASAPNTYEFRRKFSSSDTAVRRYERTLDAFGAFLASSADARHLPPKSAN